MDLYARKMRFSSSGTVSVIKATVSRFEKKTANHPTLFKLYAAPYAGVLNREIALAEISAKDVVLNVGCGAMPFTAIYLALQTGARVVAIDNDPEVIDKGRDCVRRYSLERQIEVVTADGKDIEFIRFDKALVSLQAAPKDEILQNLLKVSPSGSKLLFRQPRNIFTNHYGFVSTEGCIASVKHYMPTFGKTLLFQKR